MFKYCKIICGSIIFGLLVGLYTENRYEKGKREEEFRRGSDEGFREGFLFAQPESSIHYVSNVTQLTNMVAILNDGETIVLTDGCCVLYEQIPFNSRVSIVCSNGSLIMSNGPDLWTALKGGYYRRSAYSAFLKDISMKRP
jgi:hypothetical protein